MTTPQKKGREYEKRLEEGEIAIPLSGAGSFKEDSKTSEELIQKKLTTKASYSIKLEDLLTLERNAMMVSRSPRFDIAFEKNGKDIEYVLVPKKVYKRLRENVSD